jgi:hypothetical protein
MRELRSYGSVGAPGGKPPGSTRNPIRWEKRTQTPMIGMSFDFDAAHEPSAILGLMWKEDDASRLKPVTLLSIARALTSMIGLSLDKAREPTTILGCDVERG